MSNVLKVSLQSTIYSLHDRGWSQRRIARELEINRETVGRYLLLRSNPAISTTGSGEADQPKPAISTAGNGSGRKSQCEPLAEAIAAKAEVGLSAQRIFQDLVLEHGFSDSYESVKRYVRKLRQSQPRRICRMECEPGEEMQVDFGLGVPIHESEGARPRKCWVFRAVLSYSRKGYSEAVWSQDSETFLRCLENALRYFGGVPTVLNLDNLKAAVTKADWYDPEIHPKLADFCRHYGMNVMPCRPYKPQHKGKIERGVGYVKGNALRGRRFTSLAGKNRHLQNWETTVADLRIHGTTRKQVAALFEQERPHLAPLPPTLFPCYQEARRSVNRDSFVEVQKAYYEAPPEYIGRQVWVRWDARCVRIFNERLEQIQIHTRIEPGKFSRILGAAGLSAPVLASCRNWVGRAALLGERCGAWAQTAIDKRGPEALRAIMGLCGLSRKHSASVIDAACAKAMEVGTRRLKDIRRLIEGSQEQTAFDFAQSHPLIRDLKTYADFIDIHHNPNHDQQHTQSPRTEPETLGAA